MVSKTQSVKDSKGQKEKRVKMSVAGEDAAAPTPPVNPVQMPRAHAPPPVVAVPEDKDREDLASFAVNVEYIRGTVVQEIPLLALRLLFDKLGNLPKLNQVVFRKLVADFLVVGTLCQIKTGERDRFRVLYGFRHRENPFGKIGRDPEIDACLEKLVRTELFSERTDFHALVRSEECVILLSLDIRRVETAQNFLECQRVVNPPLHDIA